MKRSSCFLCASLDDRGGRLSLGDGLALTSDIAPLAEGHILLHSERHLGSSAMMTAPVLTRWKERILVLLNAPPFAGRSVLLFEHGTDGTTQVDVGCTDHAHIHAMAVPERDGPITSAANAVERLGPVAGPIVPFEDLAGFAGKDYFWIADRDLRLHTVAPVRPERQYLRRVVAEAIGRSDHQTWDVVDEVGAKTTMDIWRRVLAPADRGA